MIKEKTSSKATRQQKVKKFTGVPLFSGTGRRKKAVARVWVRRGSGLLVVNGKDYKRYFDTDTMRLAASKPLTVSSLGSQYDFQIRVHGGGKTGQSHAVKLGIARALLKSDEKLRIALREHSLLTVDSRVKERKKYGQKGARRKFQFVKR